MGNDECRLHNKGVYVKMGLRKMMGRKMCKDMNKEIRLEVDGKLVELPPVEGIIILNIFRSVSLLQELLLFNQLSAYSRRNLCSSYAACNKHQCSVTAINISRIILLLDV